MLSPGPLHLLVAMSRGCTLRGVRARGNEIWYVLARPSGDIERVHGRGVNTLIRLEFIERAGDEAFRVAPAGRSWIAANLDKHSSHIATLRGSNVGGRQKLRTRDAVTRDALLSSQRSRGSPEVQHRVSKAQHSVR